MTITSNWIPMKKCHGQVDTNRWWLWKMCSNHVFRVPFHRIIGCWWMQILFCCAVIVRAVWLQPKIGQETLHWCTVLKAIWWSMSIFFWGRLHFAAELSRSKYSHWKDQSKQSLALSPEDYWQGRNPMKVFHLVNQRQHKIQAAMDNTKSLSESVKFKYLSMEGFLGNKFPWNLCPLPICPFGLLLQQKPT